MSETQLLERMCHNRLQQMLARSNKTHTELAEAVGCHRQTVQSIFANGTGDLKYIIKLVAEMGYNPADLFDPHSGLFEQALTGIVSVDNMLREVYNETSPTGIERLEAHVARDYYCMFVGTEDRRSAAPEIANEFVEVPQAARYIYMTEDGNEITTAPLPRLGLTYKSERRLNEQAAAITKATKQTVLTDAFARSVELHVHYNIFEFGEGVTKTIGRNLVDIVVLNRPVMDFAEDGRLKPKIRRRQWRQVLDWSHTNQGRMRTDRKSADVK